MYFCPLFSGSSGNATYIASDDCALLIDVGLPASTIEKALKQNGIDPASIGGILVTHEHSDHIAGLGPFSRRYNVPIYANLPTWDAMSLKIGNIAEKNARIFNPGQDFYIGDMGIHPFLTPHDSAKSVGYSIFYKGKQFTYMTDIGHFGNDLLNEAKGADLVFLESNHDIDLLKNGRYPAYLKRRILSTKGHLSNKDAADALVKLCNTGVRKVMLGHLSKENNTEELARDTALSAMLSAGIKPFTDLSIGIARRSTPGKLVEI
ncbi:MAG: MBL fold metallo-hydrolase [Clostridiales bacterium]|nr:MBL fold metallo-hydrolase [Clostridiales bacterium]